MVSEHNSHVSVNIFVKYRIFAIQTDTVESSTNLWGSIKMRGGEIFQLRFTCSKSTMETLE